ncbi:hypothetical protein ACJJTC_007919 [Scirpophaga incertulas]
MTSRATRTKNINKMLVTCNKCKNRIPKEDTLLCSICNDRIEFDCAGFSEKIYRLMKPDSRKNWKCKVCTHKDTKHSVTQNKTPSYVTARKKKAVASQSDELTTSTPIQHETLTNKTPLVSNDPIENEEHQLSLQKNSLQTKNNDANQDYDTSNNSLLKFTGEDTDASFNSVTSSPLGDTKEINRSLPELRTNNSYKVETLKDKISTLAQNLNIAENEIETLLMENQNLKKRITDYELKIKELTHICKSTATVRSCSKKKKQRSVTEVDSSSSYFNIAQGKTAPASKEATNTTHITRNINHNSRNISTEGNILENTEKKLKSKCKKRNIFILGDETLKGLSAQLTKTREGKWNDVYKSSAFIINDAPSTEFLSKCDSIQKCADKNDIVILGFGNHDDDIHKLHSNICITISKFSNSSVLLLPIRHNSCFNVAQMNYCLKVWTKHFDHCTYIDTDPFDFKNFLFKRHVLSKRINACINYMEYKKLFLNITNIKKHLACTAIETGTTCEVENLNSATEAISRPLFFRY